MRVCVQKSTGRLLEAQSDAAPGALLANAGVSHPEIPRDDIEEREATPQEYAALRAAQSVPIEARIASIEAAHPITPRSLREAILLIGERFPEIKTATIYKRAMAAEAQIAPLRS